MTRDEIEKKYGKDIAAAYDEAMSGADKVADKLTIDVAMADSTTRDLRREAEKRVQHALMGMLQLADNPAQRAVIAMGVVEETLMTLTVCAAPFGGKKNERLMEDSLNYPIMLYVLGAQVFEGLIRKQLDKLGVSKEQMREMGPEAFSKLLEEKADKLRSHG